MTFTLKNFFLYPILLTSFPYTFSIMKRINITYLLLFQNPLQAKEEVIQSTVTQTETYVHEVIRT